MQGRIFFDTNILVYAHDLESPDMKERWGLNYWDALILAAAERAGCDTVYSEDLSAGQTYGAVTVQNPY